MERLLTDLGGGISRRLTTQYRMHEAIMGFSSEAFYESSLVADSSFRHYLLRDMPGVQPLPLPTTPRTFIDTAGAGYDEELEPDGETRRNPQEAEIVNRQVQLLLEAGGSPGALAVIG